MDDEEYLARRMEVHDRYLYSECEHRRYGSVEKIHAFGCVNCDGCNKLLQFVQQLVWPEPYPSTCSDCYNRWVAAGKGPLVRYRIEV